MFASNDPYSLNKLFPCFDQPNLICEFNFYTIKTFAGRIINNTNSLSYSTSDNFIINSHQLIAIPSSAEKEEILEKWDLKTDLKLINLYKLESAIKSNPNSISIVKGTSFIKTEFANKKKNYENAKINFLIPNNYDGDVKAIINSKFEKIIEIAASCLEWLSAYLNTKPYIKDLSFIFMNDLNKTITQNQGMILIDIANLNPQHNILENNYFYFLIISQVYAYVLIT